MVDTLLKLRVPATALIIAACLNAMIGLLVLLGGVARLAGISATKTLPENDAERIGYMTSTVFSYGISLLSLLLAPLIIYGAVQMMRGKNYRMAKTAAILVLVPLTSCCFFVGIPIGIWSLIVLSKPDVKAVFNGAVSLGSMQPPQPPQTW